MAPPVRWPLPVPIAFFLPCPLTVLEDVVVNVGYLDLLGESGSGLMVRAGCGESEGNKVVSGPEDPSELSSGSGPKEGSGSF